MRIALSPSHLDLAHAGCSLAVGAPSVLLASADGSATQRLETVGSPVMAQRRGSGPGGAVHATTWTWQLAGGHRLTWSVGVLADGSGCTVAAAFRNGGAEPVRLRELVLFDSGTDGLIVAGDPSAWLLTTLDHSWRIADLAATLPAVNADEQRMWAGFGQPVPYAQPQDERSNDGHWRSFNDFAFVVGPQEALALGAVGDPEATVRIDVRVGGGVNRIVASSEMSDVEVAPGAWRRGQEIVLLGGVQADITTRLLRWCAATHGARTHAGAASGWCSWYHHGNAVTASDVLAIADHVRASGLAMPVIQIDDGFQRQVGDWACNERFPGGWTPVIERIRDANAVPGVWLAPLAVHETTALFRDHPQWCQHSADGSLSGEAGNWGPRSRWLDPTHPEAAAWIRALIREHRALGFRYFKIDFNAVSGISTRAPAGARLHDRSRTAFQSLRDLYRLYREEMGEDSYLLACIGLNRAVVGHADAARIGPDSCARWHMPNPCCIRDCIRSLGQNALANGILFANDPDVSYTRPRDTLTTAELRTWHGFVGLLGGLSMISEPLTHPGWAGTDRMYELIAPPIRERGTSLDGRDPEHQRFGFIARRAWGEFAVVQLYNATAASADIDLDLDTVLGQPCHVWSFWDGVHHGVQRGRFTARQLAAHGSVVLRLTPSDASVPLLIGSDLHLGCGAAELTAVEATPQAVRIVLNDAGARDGSLWLAWHGELRVAAADGCTAQLDRVGSDCWRIRVAGRRRGGTQRIDVVG